MPNMDGTGPRWGCAHGECGHGRHMGGNRGNGCLHHGRYPTEKDALEARKEVLKQRLSEVDKRLESL